MPHLVRYMKSSASESKPFLSRSKVEIPSLASWKERLGRSKLKQAFLTDSDTKGMCNSVRHIQVHGCLYSVVFL